MSPLPFSVTTIDGIPLVGDGDLILELHPYLIFRNQPNQKHPLFQINEKGFRGTSCEGKSRGIIVGSSTAFGWPAGDSRCWIRRLQSHIETIRQAKYPITNCGVLSYILPQMRRALTELLLHMSPDWVMVIAGWSDWFNILYHPRPERFFQYHSTFFYLHGLLGSGMHSEMKHPVSFDRLSPIILQQIEHEIHALFRICHAFQTQCIFVYQPHLTASMCRSAHEKQLYHTLNEQISGYFDYAERMWLALREQYKKLRKRYGDAIIWIDPHELRGQGEVFHDYIHLTLEAQEKLSEILFTHLRKMDLVPDEKNESCVHSHHEWQSDQLTLNNDDEGPSPKPCELHIRTSEKDMPVVYCIRMEHFLSKKYQFLPVQTNVGEWVYRWIHPAWQKNGACHHTLRTIPEFKETALTHEPIPIHTFLNVLPEEYEPAPERWSYHWVTLERCWGWARPHRPPWYLEIVGAPLSDKHQFWMYVSLDNIEIARIPMEPQYCRYRIVLPDRLKNTDGRVLLEFSPAFTPAELGIAPDPRILSAKIHSLAWVHMARKETIQHSIPQEYE